MTTVVLHTRDLRVRDHPGLAEACRGDGTVVPLFVVDERLLRGPHTSPNRAVFLAQALADLRSSLRGLGGDLVVRRGDPVAETLRLARAVGADRVVVAADVSRYAARRLRDLAAAGAAHGVEVRTAPGVCVVPPGELRPTGGDHYRVFTPYWRAWERAARRSIAPTPRRVRLPDDLPCGHLPSAGELLRLLPEGLPEPSPELPEGGETAGRRRLDAAVRAAKRAADRAGPAVTRAAGPSVDRVRDDLAADATSRLSPYLHFGCVSPLVAADRLAEPAPEVVRQLAWRDFHHQVAAAFPDLAVSDYRDRGRLWREDPAAYAAWCEGRTGVPIVDAGMRQLRTEGWMHNRARMLVASYLTKTLGLDWRLGAAHFFRWLVDGDFANNAGNWQWCAGTGNDTRPGRVLNPIRQALRFDADGTYVRRHVPELREVPGRQVHQPWRLPDETRATLDYPPPLTGDSGTDAD